MDTIKFLWFQVANTTKIPVRRKIRIYYRIPEFQWQTKFLIRFHSLHHITSTRSVRMASSIAIQNPYPFQSDCNKIRDSSTAIQIHIHLRAPSPSTWTHPQPSKSISISDPTAISAIPKNPIRCKIRLQIWDHENIRESLQTLTNWKALLFLSQNCKVEN